VGHRAVSGLHRYCTYFDHRYLERGLAMIRSLRQVDPGQPITVLCLTPECMRELTRILEPGISLISLEDFEHANPALLAAKADRSTLEYYFTLSGSIVSYMLEKADLDDIVTYVDADLLFYSSVAPIYQEMGQASVGLIAHRYHWWKRSNIKFGRFNVGWASFRSDEIGRSAARWWRDRCLEWCHDYIDGDRFADQKYLDTMFTIFPNIVEITHPGANVAPWNLGRHRITGNDSEPLTVDGRWPLIFFHFQGLKETSPSVYLVNHLPYFAPFTRTVRNELYLPYATQLERIRAESGLKSPLSQSLLSRGSTKDRLPLRQRLFELRTLALRAAARWAGHYVGTKVLFIGPLPMPMMGQAYACEVFLEALKIRHTVDIIDLNKHELSHRTDILGRVFEVFSIILAARKKARTCACIYMNVSQSIPGNLKDLFIYLVTFEKLSRMTIHLHGEPGMRELLSSTHPWLRAINSFFLRRIGAVIVLSRHHVDIFSGLVTADRIQIVPYFAPKSLYLDAPDIVRKFSQTRPLRLLFLSNLLPGKGYLELIEAYRDLAPDIKENVRIDFAGGFESEKDEETFMDAIEFLPGIQFHGVVVGDAKTALFRNAHLFCLPTYYRYEGLPISMFEAFAAGCVVLTTDHSAIFDIFTPGESGFCVEKRSAASIREAIETAVSDPAALQRMALNNRQVADQYPVERYQDRLIKIVDDMMPVP